MVFPPMLHLFLFHRPAPELQQKIRIPKKATIERARNCIGGWSHREYFPSRTAMNIEA
jgi:hypothetical protein